jgi:hypothetical protein
MDLEDSKPAVSTLLQPHEAFAKNLQVSSHCKLVASTVRRNMLVHHGDSVSDIQTLKPL